MDDGSLDPWQGDEEAEGAAAPDSTFPGAEGGTERVSSSGDEGQGGNELELEWVAGGEAAAHYVESQPQISEIFHLMPDYINTILASPRRAGTSPAASVAWISAFAASDIEGARKRLTEDTFFRVNMGGRIMMNMYYVMLTDEDQEETRRDDWFYVRSEQGNIGFWLSPHHLNERYTIETKSKLQPAEEGMDGGGRKKKSLKRKSRKKRKTKRKTKRKRKTKKKRKKKKKRSRMKKI